MKGLRLMMTMMMCVTLVQARWVYVPDNLYGGGLQRDPYSSSWRGLRRDPYSSFLSKRCIEENRICYLHSDCCDGMSCVKQKSPWGEAAFKRCWKQSGPRTKEPESPGCKPVSEIDPNSCIPMENIGQFCLCHSDCCSGFCYLAAGQQSHQKTC